MRFSDLVKLALISLWQQKRRAALATLGVVFGSFVLLASLSIRTGVKERVTQEYARFRELREVQIHTGRRTDAHGPPKDDLALPGDMSEAKRERLRKEIIRKWQWYHARDGRVHLTKTRLGRLRRVRHVKAVRPHLAFHGRAVFGSRAEYAGGFSGMANDHSVAKRIIAGAYFRKNDVREVLVSEYLMYRLGVVNDADIPGVIGKTLHVEYRGARPNPNALVSLLSGSHANIDAANEDILHKIVKRLPNAIAKLKLSQEEKTALDLLMKPPDAKDANSSDPIAEDFRIAGVFCNTSADGPGPNRWLDRDADLIFPVDTMAAFLFRDPERSERGFESAIVEVDDVKNVKTVVNEIRSLGLSANSLVEVIEREQALYTMIFSAMSVVAVIALLVAALGIANTMFMSVLERVREIGIMKAVGAHSRHIQALFLIEGAFIGLLGGTFGALLALAASNPGDAWVQSMVQEEMSIELHGSIFAFPWQWLFGVPLFATLVTTLAAVLPARHAARVNPVEALRHE